MKMNQSGTLLLPAPKAKRATKINLRQVCANILSKYNRSFPEIAVKSKSDLFYSLTVFSLVGVIIIPYLIPVPCLLLYQAKKYDHDED